MLRTLIVVIVIGGMAWHFGLFEQYGPVVTEKLPEGVQHYSPWQPTPTPIVSADDSGNADGSPDTGKMVNYEGLGSANREAVQPDSTPEAEQELTVLSVQDGDTLTVGYMRYPMRIRLAGIDAPESDQPGGERAMRYLKTCAGDDIIVNVVDQDQYGRLVGYVHPHEGSASCNLQLVREGLAYSYINPTMDILDAEQMAMQRGLGVWNDEGAIRPSDWRKMNPR